MQTEQQKQETKPNGTNGAAPAAAITTTTPTQGATLTTFGESNSIAAFASLANFEAAQRMARALSESSLVPQAYQRNMPNCLIAMELASRVQASVFMVMQNLDIIHGRPSWSARFLIATVNASGRFTPLRYRFEGTPGTDGWGCRAFAKDKATGEECLGTLITIGIAKAEGWHGKNGSKWKTMPEQMLTYRAASFWSRIYAPEISLGMQTTEEVIDTHGIEVRSVDLPGQRQPGSPERLTAALLELPPEPEPEPPSSPKNEEPAKAAEPEPKEEPKPAKRSSKKEEPAADPETGELFGGREPGDD